MSSGGQVHVLDRTGEGHHLIELADLSVFLSLHSHHNHRTGEGRVHAKTLILRLLESPRRSDCLVGRCEELLQLRSGRSFIDSDTPRLGHAVCRRPVGVGQNLIQNLSVDRAIRHLGGFDGSSIPNHFGDAGWVHSLFGAWEGWSVLSLPANGKP